MHDPESDLRPRQLSLFRGLVTYAQVVRDDEVAGLPLVAVLNGAVVLGIKCAIVVSFKKINV